MSSVCLSYRSLFPYLDTGTIYMNHAAVSPFSQPVVDVLQHYIHQRSVTQIENYFAFQPTLQETREQIAFLLNTQPERIAFVRNTSDGLNILASGFPWQKGDRIILNDLEFPSNIYPFLNCQHFGVEIDWVRHQDGKILLEDIELLITLRTRLISISHVQFLTGYRINLEKLGQLCKAHNILFV